jgi:hypothetical protein
MTLQEIAEIRLSNQKIAGSEYTTAGDLVRWMGAVQAQDYAMAKWAIGARLVKSTEEEIDAALSSGELIRMHLMRPTWHLVPAADVRWMLDLTAPRIRSGMKGRHRQLGITDAVVKKSNTVIEKALVKHTSLTKEELAAEFERAGLRTDENRFWHLVLCAELDGIVCNGPLRGNKQTFALLAERVPEKMGFTREESLAELARRYFTSHGPATVRDFAWWSGLSLTDAKQGAERIRTDFITEQAGPDKYWFRNPGPGRIPLNPLVRLLPAYDEFLIAYADRSASLPEALNRKTVSVNGIFRPVIVVNGQVAGIWKRTVVKDRVLVECSVFKPLTKQQRALAETEVQRYGRFLQREVGVKFVTG